MASGLSNTRCNRALLRQFRRNQFQAAEFNPLKSSLAKALETLFWFSALEK
jgi:hypothetical protein